MICSTSRAEYHGQVQFCFEFIFLNFFYLCQVLARILPKIFHKIYQKVSSSHKFSENATFLVRNFPKNRQVLEIDDHFLKSVKFSQHRQVLARQVLASTTVYLSSYLKCFSQKVR